MAFRPGRFCRINTNLLVFKLYYLFTFSGKACIEPFLSVFLRYVGMSAEQAGIITGLQPLARLIGAPLFGAFADRYRKHRAVMLAMCSISTAILFSLVFFQPPELQTTKSLAACNNSLPANSSTSKQYTDNTTLCDRIENCTLMDPFSALCRNHSENNTGELTAVMETDNSKTFMSLIFVVFTYSLFANFNSMADAATVKYLSSINRGGDYGKQRLWGAIGWGLIAIVAGLTIDQSSSHLHQSHFLLAFCGFLVFSIAASVTAYKLPLEFLEGPSKPNIFQNVWIILTDCSIITFLCAILVMGTCMSTIAIFLFWFLQDIGGSHLIMGLALSMTCVAEAPVMFFSGDMIRLVGHHNILYLTFACYTVRYLLYSFIPNAWYVLAIEPLHGVTFGAMWVATTSYGGIISPEGMAATVMGLVSATHFGLGNVLGGFVGGTLYSSYGPRALFRGLAVTSAVSCALFYFSQKILNKGSHASYLHFQLEDDIQEMDDTWDLGMTEIDLDCNEDLSTEQESLNNEEVSV